jgi:hypothetical protein
MVATTGPARLWRLAAMVAAVLAIGTAATVGTGPAAGAAGGAPVSRAQEPPTIVITPGTEPGTVDVAVDDPLPDGWALHLCDAAVGATPDRLDAVRWCSPGYAPLWPPEEPGGPHTAHLYVDPAFLTVSADVIDCGDTAEDCAVLVGPPDLQWNSELGELHATPFSWEPPTLAVTPSIGMEDGADVVVRLHGPAGASWAVATCAASYNWDTGFLDVTDRCAPATSAVLGPDGRAELAHPVTAMLAAEGPPVDCRLSSDEPESVRTSCAVVVRDPDGAVVASRAIRVRAPLAIEAWPTTGLGAIPTVYGEVTGRRDTFLALYQCAASVTGSEGLDGPCVEVTPGFPPEVNPGSRDQGIYPALRPTFTGADGTAVDCRTGPGACVLAVGFPGADQFVSIPVTFATTALTPSAGLLDGQPVTVTATGVEPGAGFRVVRCDRATLTVYWTCEDPAGAPAVAADQAGALTTTAPAAQRFTTVQGTPAYCRDECAVVLIPDDPAVADLRLPYALAEGELAAAPATGLTDGQQVTVTGSGLMDSYAGPPVWFLTSGGWGLAQCGRAIVDDVSILGVFTHCVGAGAGPAEVTGGEVEAAVTVRSTITPLTGTPVDCAAAPDACVVVLARVEQDGTTSVHAAPIAFAP